MKTITKGEILEHSRIACHNAVEHVGAANYPEREAEAHKWVEEAFKNLVTFLNANSNHKRSEKVLL